MPHPLLRDLGEGAQHRQVGPIDQLEDDGEFSIFRARYVCHGHTCAASQLVRIHPHVPGLGADARLAGPAKKEGIEQAGRQRQQARESGEGSGNVK